MVQSIHPKLLTKLNKVGLQTKLHSNSINYSMKLRSLPLTMSRQTLLKLILFQILKIVQFLFILGSKIQRCHLRISKFKKCGIMSYKQMLYMHKSLMVTPLVLWYQEGSFTTCIQTFQTQVSINQTLRKLKIPIGKIMEFSQSLTNVHSSTGQFNSI